MPQYVDPKTGEHFDNDAEDADARAAQVGLVPKAQYEADNQSFLDKAGDVGMAVVGGLGRPLEALRNATGTTPIGQSPYDTPEQRAAGYSPSSPAMRKLAAEHPIASQLPLAAEALLPGGPLVQMAAGTLGSAAESSFAGGSEYGAINPDELLQAAALGGAGAAAGPILRGAGKLAVKGSEAAVEGLYGAGRAIGAAANAAGQTKVGRDVVEGAVGKGLRAAGVAVGAAVGHAPGAFVGHEMGQRLGKKYASRIADAILGKQPEEVLGTGILRHQQFEGIEGGLTPEMLGEMPKPPIEPEAVAMGTGFGPIFRKAEDAMSPTLKRAKEILARREQQAGHTILGARERHGLAPQAFPSVRALDEERLHQSIAKLPESGWVKPDGEASHSMHGVNVSRDVRDKLTAHSNEVYADKMSQAERDAIDAYTGGEYQNIRAIQKGEAPASFDAKHDATLRTKAADLDTAVDKISIENPTQHGPLYRGMPATPEMLDELMRHDEFVTSASTSSSYAPGMAMGFAGNKPTNSVLIKFEKVDHGAPLFGEAGMGESEVLLPRGAKYKVTGRHRTEDGELLVTVKQVGRASPDEMRDLGALGAVTFSPGKPGRTPGPNFSLGDIAKSPIGVTTGIGSAIGVGNVLARAERRANESTSFDDLDDMSEPDRRAALASNAHRYMQQANDSTVNALEGKTDAYVAAKGLARKRLGDLAADPSDAQRAYADTALTAIDGASQALRDNGDGATAKALDQVADSLTDVSAAHREKAPIDHDSGELLGQLDHAYSILRAHGSLPPDAQSALQDLEQGTTRPELWGQAADMLADTRQADDGVDKHDITDSSDPDTWRQNLAEHVAAARHQVDVLDKWGVDTEKLTGKLDELSDAIDRGEAVTAEMHAAGIRSSDGRTDAWDQGPAADILGSVSQEMGGGVDVDSVLAPSARQALEQQQKAYRYDTALRSVQRGADLTLKRAARGMVGLGSSTQTVDPDASNAAFSEGYSDEVAAFDARRSMIQQLGKDPMALADSMSTSYGELVKTHPEVYDQISSMVVRATDILTEAMPPSILQSIQSPRGLPPSIDDVRAFSRIFMAVTEPETYLRDLGAGQAWPEQSMAFAKMYPQQWSKLSETALQAAQQRGPELSPQDATYLDITFNVGNNLGGMWSDSGAKAIRDAVTAAQQQRQSKAGKPPPGPAGATIPTMATQALGAGPSSTPVS